MFSLCRFPHWTELTCTHNVHHTRLHQRQSVTQSQTHEVKSFIQSMGKCSQVIVVIVKTYLFYFCFSAPTVVRHHCHGGHSSNGRGPWTDHRPAGWPRFAPQHLHLTAGCEQTTHHTAHLPAAAPATPCSPAQPYRCLHFVGLWGGTWERREDIHP